VVEDINDLTTTHTATSEMVVTWVCTSCQHQYRMSIFDRTRDHGCPNCTRAKNQKAAAGLSATHLEIAAQWHPKFNGDRLEPQWPLADRDFRPRTYAVQSRTYVSTRINIDISSYAIHDPRLAELMVVMPKVSFVHEAKLLVSFMSRAGLPA